MLFFCSVETNIKHEPRLKSTPCSISNYFCFEGMEAEKNLLISHILLHYLCFKWILGICTTLNLPQSPSKRKIGYWVKNYLWLSVHPYSLETAPYSKKNTVWCTNAKMLPFIFALQYTYLSMNSVLLLLLTYPPKDSFEFPAHFNSNEKENTKHVLNCFFLFFR